MKTSITLEEEKPDGYYLVETDEPLICPFCKMVYFSGLYRKHLQSCSKKQKRTYRRSFNGYLYLQNKE